LAACESILVDIGSTYTKVVLVDVRGEHVIGVAQAPTTFESDICIGLEMALSELGLTTEALALASHKVACSSAGGGLGMVVVGLVPSLTMEAGKRAALGAGAKVVGSYSYDLTDEDVEEINELSPDIVMLAGGTDGGNREVPIQNARHLAPLGPQVSIVVACNRAVASEVKRILTYPGRTIKVVDNVMPSLGTLEVTGARKAIRELFVERIVKAKGLKRVEALIDAIVMPTPVAVLSAGELLARGTQEESGMGELVVVDIGGATTDVHSLSSGTPTKANVIQKGLPEPFAKRTVEGDLGIRCNADSILEAVGKQRLLQNIGLEDLDLESTVRKLTRETATLPRGELEEAIDAGLAKSALEKAMERHAGKIEVDRSPFGEVYLQHGKDLTQTPYLIGTGGVFRYNRYRRRILAGALFDMSTPTSLRPRSPGMLVDDMYILAPMGLLAKRWPDMAVRMMKRLLIPV